MDIAESIPEAAALAAAASSPVAALSGGTLAAAPNGTVFAAATSGGAVAAGLITVDGADFAAMAASMQEEDERRERLIRGSRDVLKSSKVAIYSLHRREFAKAQQLLDTAKAALRDELLPAVAAQPQLRFSLSGACEEYAEAVVFQQYLLTGRVPTLASMGGIVSRDEFLGGVLDFAGELGRFAVLRATSRDFDAVKRARECVDEMMSQFMLFDFRNGGLRRKYDGLKYTLKKVSASRRCSCLAFKQELSARGEAHSTRGRDN